MFFNMLNIRSNSEDLLMKTVYSVGASNNFRKKHNFVFLGLRMRLLILDQLESLSTLNCKFS